MNASQVITLARSDYETLAGLPTSGGVTGAPEIAPARAPTPEDILRAVFRQALTGKPASMPNGATVSTLRQALVLDPLISTRIYNEMKAEAAALAAPGALPVSLPAKIPANARRLRPRLAFAAGCMLALGFVVAVVLAHRPPHGAESFSGAYTNATAYADLLARAQAGDRQAQFALARILDRRFAPHETVTPKNDALAFVWYGQAAGAGFIPAAQALGYGYLNGHGVARDPAAAAHWFGVAAKAGLAVAQNDLGTMYRAGIGVPQDNFHAAQWFAEAAARGLPDAQNNLGAAYQSGDGVTQNYATAALWYARAAQQGDPEAQNNLGFLFFDGLGVPHDTTKSARLFTAAAQAGLPAGEVNLALSLAAGAGVAKNPAAAAAWCLRAEKAGAKDAGAALAMIAPQLTAAQMADAKAAAK